MDAPHKKSVLDRLTPLLGTWSKLARGNSLYLTASGAGLYVRYSRRHELGIGFFGLRTCDLTTLQAKTFSYVVFHTDMEEDLVVVPLAKMLELLSFSRPAQDGMYKLQISFLSPPEMRIPGVGRIGVGAYSGLPLLLRAAPSGETLPPDRLHSKIQYFLKEIGFSAGNDVWVPRADRGNLIDKSELGTGCVSRLELVMPSATRGVIENVDVIWLEKGRHLPLALFEVEHTTTIYSGLLRLNDVLVDYRIPHAAVVTDAKRHENFIRQVHRRTFEVSGLTELCTHYTYEEVTAWFQRVKPPSASLESPD